LQDQHYDQYMRQIYQKQLFSDQQGNGEAGNEVQVPETQEEILPAGLTSSGENDAKDGSDQEESSSIAAASMWTRKDVKEFKESVRSEGGEAIIRVGQGESVTVTEH